MKREIKVIPHADALTDDEMLTLDAVDEAICTARRHGATHIFVGNGNLYAAEEQSDKDYIHALVARVEKLEQRLREIGRTGPERFIAEGGLEALK